MSRRITMTAYASAKGGVGKTTLAMLTAALLARRGRCPIVIDVDVSGTSPADALPLLAPQLGGEGPGRESSSVMSPSGSWLDRAKTRRARLMKRAAGTAGLGRHLLYLNDLLDREPVPSRLGDWLWRFEGIPEIRVLPSSPLPADYDRAVAWTTIEGRWKLVRKLWERLLGLVAEDPSLTDFVIDLPPGLYGIGHAMLTLLAHLEHGESLPDDYLPLPAGLEVSVYPVIVVTADTHDLAVASEAYIDRRPRLPSLRLILNRRDEPLKDVQARLDEHFGPLYGRDVFGVGSNLRHVDYVSGLNRLFRGEPLVIPSEREVALINALVPWTLEPA